MEELRYSYEAIGMASHAIRDYLAPALLAQPVAGLDDLAALQAELKAPICLDESITSPRRAEQALRLGGCRLINIKVGCVGGHSTAQAN